MKKTNSGQRKPGLHNKRSVELNKLIRTAALTVDPQARIEPLAERCGLTGPAVRAAIRRGYFTAGQACALELTFGSDLCPKEKLCPEKFAHGGK